MACAKVVRDVACCTGDGRFQIFPTGYGESAFIAFPARSLGCAPCLIHCDVHHVQVFLLSGYCQSVFRATIRLVRHNEFVMGGIIDASVRIFLDVVSANRSQFLFLAREQYGGCLAVRQAIGALREDITRDLAADLTFMPKLQHLDAEGLHVMADLIVKSVFATLPDIIDPPAQALPDHLTPQAKITQQLRFIFIGLKHWQGLGSTE